MEGDHPMPADPGAPSETGIAGASNLAIDEIKKLAIETFGTREIAQTWLRRPTTVLADSSPLDIASGSESGARMVIDLLKRIDHGLAM